MKVFNPNQLLNLINKFVLCIFILGCLFLTFGFYYVFFVSPNDYQQGIMVKIMYIHVPSAWLSMGIYTLIAVTNLLFLIRKIPTASIIAKASAPLGLIFTLIVLVSGIFWGRPMWGVWWVWDARLTSMLILAFLYLGVIGLRAAVQDPDQAGKACGILVLVGVVNLPIIKYSVEWWNTLHQPASLKLTEKPAMPASMWVPLLVNILGYYIAAAYLVLGSMRAIVLERERRATWVKELVSRA